MKTIKLTEDECLWIEEVLTEDLRRKRIEQEFFSEFILSERQVEALIEKVRT